MKELDQFKQLMESVDSISFDSSGTSTHVPTLQEEGEEKPTITAEVIAQATRRMENIDAATLTKILERSGHTENNVTDVQFNSFYLGEQGITAVYRIEFEDHGNYEPDSGNVYVSWDGTDYSADF